MLVVVPYVSVSHGYLSCTNIDDGLHTHIRTHPVHTSLREELSIPGCIWWIHTPLCLQLTLEQTKKWHLCVYCNEALKVFLKYGFWILHSVGFETCTVNFGYCRCKYNLVNILQCVKVLSFVIYFKVKCVEKWSGCILNMKGFSVFGYID